MKQIVSILFKNRTPGLSGSRLLILILIWTLISIACTQPDLELPGQDPVHRVFTTCYQFPKYSKLQIESGNNNSKDDADTISIDSITAKGVVESDLEIRTDWYTFEVPYTCYAQFAVDSPRKTEIYCYLYDADDTFILSFSPGKPYFRCLYSSRYYIKVTGQYFDEIEYLVSVKAPFEVENNDIRDYADEVNVYGITMKGHLCHNRVRHDYFKFKISRGENKNLLLKGVGPNSYYLSGNVYLGTSQNALFTLQHGVTQTFYPYIPGTYYIKVDGYSGIDYELTVR